MKTITPRLLSFAAACLASPAFAQTVARDFGGVSALEQRMNQYDTSSIAFLTNARLAEGPAMDERKDGSRDGTVPSKDMERLKRPSGSLEEIVVTAQKREERLIDTPISIGVLSGVDIDRSSSRGLAETLNQVSGVAVTQGSPGEATIAVRGVVAGGAGVSTTAYYMDEVPFAFVRFPALLDTDSFDLARVEVLRGPQGTLYGASALGGVVRVLSNDANVDDFEAKARVRGSSTEGGGDGYGAHAAINVPLIAGKLAVRGVAGHSDLTGFIRSTFDGRNRINDSQTDNYRLKVNYQPTDDLGIKLGYSRSKINTDAPSMSLYGEGYETPYTSDQPSEQILDMYSLVAEYSWPGMSLLSSTGYIDYVNTSNPLLIPPSLTFIDVQGVTSFSQEFRLSSQDEGPWRWTAGAFYKEASHRTANDIRPLLAGVNRQREHSESYAGFLDVTRSSNEGKFEITAGVRYFEDRVVSREQGNFGNVLPLLPDESAKFNDVSGRLVFTYKLQRGRMFYGSVVTGFRSGQHQTPTVRRNAPGFPPADPDSLITYELGTKGLLFGGVASYETAVYYMDWKDVQQILNVPFPNIGSVLARVNAGRASGPGADASLTYEPLRDVTLHVSIGWNDLRFDQNIFSQNSLLFAKDDRLNDSPQWTGSIGADYRTLTPKNGVDFVMSANFAYGSQRVSRGFQPPPRVRVAQSDDFGQLGATIGVEGDRWSLAIYGDNLLNRDSAITPPDLIGNSSVIQMPRTVGMQAMFTY